MKTPANSKVKEGGKNKLNMTKAPRGVILVKIPTYLQELLMNGPPGVEIGKLKIYNDKSKKPVFVINKEHQSESIPSQHEFLVSESVDSKLFIMSEGKNPSMDEGSMAIEGNISKRASMRPIMNSDYVDWKRGVFKAANTPERQTVQLNGHVNNFKPMTNSHGKMKEEEKNVRKDKDLVKDQLFSIFEKHQYYKLHDLISLTKQPVGYLKEILKEICRFNPAGVHRGTYELKLEYRHYKA